MVSLFNHVRKFRSKLIVQHLVASASDDDSGSDTSGRQIQTTKIIKRALNKLGASAIQTTVANTAMHTQSMSNAIVISNVSASHSPTIQPLQRWTRQRHHKPIRPGFIASDRSLFPALQRWTRGSSRSLGFPILVLVLRLFAKR